MAEKENVQDARFLDHLDVLRGVLLKILLFAAAACVPCWFLAPKALSFLLEYAAPAGFRLHYFSLMEPFLVRLKIMLALAFFFTFPGSAALLWRFVAPGLLPEERKAVRWPAVSMFFLALGGIVLVLLLIVPALIRFSLSFAEPGMEPVIGIGDFTGLVLSVLLAGVLLFQFPVLLYFLLWTGILSVASIRKKRPHVIVLIFILSAVFSPPDVFSQVVLAVPAWMLFELSLFFFEKRFSGKDRSFETIYENKN